MNITIQISDSVYQDLVKNNRRVRGTIGLINPKEGNFNAHRRQPYVRPEVKFCRLPHGRVSVSEERVNLTLRIDRRETDLIPHEAIDLECMQAADFVCEQTIDNRNK